MASSRRTISSSSLSFLDIMFCGFGAVVLLVLIVNTNIITSQQESVEDLRSEFMRQELLNRMARDHLKQVQQEYTEVQKDNKTIQENNAALSAQIQQTTTATVAKSQKADTQGEISKLQDELKALENEKEQLAAQKAAEREAGRKVRKFEGEGNRQYLTGLKLGGQRVLILVDSSASMLDTKIVDIIRRKVLDESSRRRAPKWQKTVSTVEWLIANLPTQSSIQLYNFNTAATAITADDKPGWVPVENSQQIDVIVSKLKQIAPFGGTNLDDAFLKARTISPKPDNIILLTDGLPTQGKGGTRARTINGKRRVKLFEQAIKYLPNNAPVNTILFPIEGDPLASVLYWKLAIESGGSFFTPTSDWP